MKPHIKFIISFIILLSIVIIASVTHFDLNKIVSKVNVDNKNVLKRENVKLVECKSIDNIKFIENGKIYSYRFLGINKLNNKIDKYTCDILKKSKISISYEKDTVTKQNNERLVWIYVNDELLQTKLIKKGYAKPVIYYDMTYIDKIINFKDNITLNSSNMCTVLFLYNGVKKEKTVKCGELTKPINNPIKKGYKFAGWKVDNKYFDFSLPVNNNYILKADFIKE